MPTIHLHALYCSYNNICNFTQDDSPSYPTVSVIPPIHNLHAFSALYCSYSFKCKFTQDDSPPYPTVSVMPTRHNVHAFSALYCSYILCPSPFIPGFLFYSKIRKYHVCLFFQETKKPGICGRSIFLTFSPYTSTEKAGKTDKWNIFATFKNIFYNKCIFCWPCLCNPSGVGLPPWPETWIQSKLFLETRK